MDHMSILASVKSSYLPLTFDFCKGYKNLNKKALLK